jgi:undecaprenyl-diphosphatase
VTDWLRATILGIVEGLTEFLPVSSTGHMILTKPLIGVNESEPKWAVFLFVCQLGAILAVAIYFRREIYMHVVHHVRPRGNLLDLLATKLTVAMIPAIIAGLLLNDFMEAHLENSPAAVAGALIVGGVIMEIIDRRFRRTGEMNIEDVSLRQALWIGIAQCLSLWPGTSRSMATILGGMVVGLPVRTSAEFSFLLAIPIMLLASAYRCFKYRHDLTIETLDIIGIGSLVAFVVALVVVAGFMQFIRRYRLTVFSVYRVILGILVLVLANS